MKKLELARGEVAQLDEPDYDRLRHFKWYCIKGYAYRTVYLGKVDGKYKYTTIPMHREVLNPLDGLLADHIDGNRLNNTRNNLRAVTRGQNTINSAMRKTNRYGYKGIIYNPLCTKRPWYARIKLNGKVQVKGYFETREEAALAYNELATQLHGQYARLNEIPN